MYSGGNASSLPLISGKPEPTIKQLSSKGRKAYNFPKLDVPEKDIQIEIIQMAMLLTVSVCFIKN